MNMAEIEINVMGRQCTGGRIESKEKLELEVSTCSKDRNERKCNIEWKFTRGRTPIRNYQNIMFNN